MIFKIINKSPVNIFLLNDKNVKVPLHRSIIKNQNEVNMLLIPIFISQMVHNVIVYGKLRVCVRGFSEGKSEASKQATNFGLAKTSNFFYTVLCNVFIWL